MVKPMKKMIELHPNVLKNKEGREEFVILPFEEFQALREFLEDAEDLMDLRAAKEKEAGAPTVSLSQAKKELGVQ